MGGSTVAHWYDTCFPPGSPGFKSGKGENYQLINNSNLNGSDIWLIYANPSIFLSKSKYSVLVNDKMIDCVGDFISSCCGTAILGPYIKHRPL